MQSKMIFAPSFQPNSRVAKYIF